MIKYKLKKEIVTRISMKLDKENYAKYFLAIFNNARENKKIFYRVESIADSNDVYIICNNDYVNKVSDYLKQFGEIYDTEQILRNIISVVADYDGFDELYGECSEDLVIFDIEID